MITTKHEIAPRHIRHWVALFLLVCSMPLGATPAAAQAPAEPLAGALVERPEPLGWMTKRFFKDNTDCVDAKLDLWFWRGRYTHQLFTARSSGEHDRLGPRPAASEQAPSSMSTWEGDKANPATQQFMDADSTTVLIGREGCRYRIRIERVE